MKSLLSKMELLFQREESVVVVCTVYKTFTEVYIIFTLFASVLKINVHKNTPGKIFSHLCLVCTPTLSL